MAAHLRQIVQVGCTPANAGAEVHVTRLTERRQYHLHTAHRSLPIHRLCLVLTTTSRGTAARCSHHATLKLCSTGTSNLAMPPAAVQANTEEPHPLVVLEDDDVSAGQQHGGFHDGGPNAPAACRVVGVPHLQHEQGLQHRLCSCLEADLQVRCVSRQVTAQERTVTSTL